MGRNAVTQSTTGDLFDDEEEDESLVHGHRKRKVAFEPSPGKSIADPNPVLFPINTPWQKRHTQYTTEVTG